MTTMAGAIRARLEGDATLAALATGGIFDWDETGREGLSIGDILESNSPAIKPALLIRMTTQSPQGAPRYYAVQAFFEIYAYQDSGYSTITAMLERVYELLNHQRVSFNEPTGYWMYQMEWAGDVLNQVEDSLGGASMSRSRYVADLVRR